MLVLTRRIDEKIYVGESIVITVASVRGQRVRVLIEAPPEVSIHREEVYEAIQSGTPGPKSATIPMQARKEFSRLVLTRRKEEAIRIGDDIRLIVVEIRDGRVRLGFQAPEDVTVHRKEVYERIKAANNPSKKSA